MITLHEYNNPLLYLKTEEEMLEYCKHPFTEGLDPYRVRCDYIIGIIEDYEKLKFAYNDDITNIIMSRHPHLSRETVDTLVYNAQSFKWVKHRLEAGEFILTQELLEQAFEQNRKFMVGGLECTPKKWGDKIYCVPKHSKRKYLFVWPEGKSTEPWARYL